MPISTDISVDPIITAPLLDFINGYPNAFSFTVIILYFLPLIIACFRRHQQMPAIFVLNLFTGWTFFGWVGAFVWSVIRYPLKHNYDV